MMTKEDYAAKDEFEAAAWNKAYGEAMDRGDADPLPCAERAARLACNEWDTEHTARVSL